MSANHVDAMEREAIKLVGFAIVESLSNVLETKIVGTLREDLVNRMHEIDDRKGTGVYLIQIYPSDGHWTPHVPFQHVIALEVASHGELPEGMVAYTVPSGHYVKFTHEGLESTIGDTYEFINNTYGTRPVDIEYWSDIHALDREDSRIEIYVPGKA